MPRKYEEEEEEQEDLTEPIAWSELSTRFMAVRGVQQEIESHQRAIKDAKLRLAGKEVSLVNGLHRARASAEADLARIRNRHLANRGRDTQLPEASGE